MKKKRIFGIIVVALLLIGVAYTIFSHGKQYCKGVKVVISYNDASKFISEIEIEREIRNIYPDLNNTVYSDIEVGKIRKVLESNPYIHKAQVSLGLNGIVEVNIDQKEPIARVFNKKGDSYYLTSECKLMPLSNIDIEHLIVVSGEINQEIDIVYSGRSFKSPSNYHELALYIVWKLASYIRQNIFLSAQIDQIIVTENLEIELIPLIGEQLIILGDIDNLEIKFQNLETLYTQGFQMVGWDKYKTINLKYINQVVCTRK